MSRLESLVFLWRRRVYGEAPHSTLDTLHSTLYTLHFTLLTPHLRLYTPHSTLYTSHSSLYTPHSSLHTPHSTLSTPHSTLYTLHSTLYTLHSTLYTPHFTFYTPHSTLHTLHFPLRNLKMDQKADMIRKSPPASLAVQSQTSRPNGMLSRTCLAEKVRLRHHHKLLAASSARKVQPLMSSPVIHHSDASFLVLSVDICTILHLIFVALFLY